MTPKAIDHQIATMRPRIKLTEAQMAKIRQEVLKAGEGLEGDERAYRMAFEILKQKMELA